MKLINFNVKLKGQKTFFKDLIGNHFRYCLALSYFKAFLVFLYCFINKQIYVVNDIVTGLKTCTSVEILYVIRTSSRDKVVKYKYFRNLDKFNH